MTSDHPHISFIIPAYNEEGHLRVTTEESIKVLNDVCPDFEIIIIDDGSTDRTGVIAANLKQIYPGLKVLHNDVNRGFGYTCRRGILEARGRFIGWVSADTTWDAVGLKEAVKALGQTDIITAYYTNTQERSYLRRFISRSFTIFLNLVFGLKMEYYNGGCFHRADLIKPLKLKSAGLTLWAEALVRLLKEGYTCRQIGMYNPPRKQGRCKAFHVRNIWGTVRIIVILFYDIYFKKTGASR